MSTVSTCAALDPIRTSISDEKEYVRPSSPGLSSGLSAQRTLTHWKGLNPRQHAMKRTDSGKDTYLKHAQIPSWSGLLGVRTQIERPEFCSHSELRSSLSFLMSSTCQIQEGLICGHHLYAIFLNLDNSMPCLCPSCRLCPCKVLQGADYELCKITQHCSLFSRECPWGRVQQASADSITSLPLLNIIKAGRVASVPIQCVTSMTWRLLCKRHWEDSQLGNDRG